MLVEISIDRTFIKSSIRGDKIIKHDDFDLISHIFQGSDASFCGSIGMRYSPNTQGSFFFGGLVIIIPISAFLGIRAKAAKAIKDAATMVMANSFLNTFIEGFFSLSKRVF